MASTVATTTTAQREQPLVTARTVGNVEALFASCAAVLVFHLVLDGFLRMGPEWSPRGELMMGLISASVIVALGLQYPRYPRAAQGGVSLLIGLFGFVHATPLYLGHLVKLGFSPAELPGLASIVAGLALVLLGIALLASVLPHWSLRVVLVPVGIVVLAWLSFPLSASVYITNIPRVPLGDETPADYGLAYEDVTFENSDGDTLSGWYVPSQNGAAIIIVHGSGGNRAGGLERAAMLADHGYGVLLFELRGFGESDGEPVGLGWTGVEDVAPAIDYLEGRPDIVEGRIGGLGISMGGEVLLEVEATDPRLQAVVADGVEVRAAEELLELPGSFSWIGAPTYFINTSMVALLSGQDQPPPLHEIIGDIAPRPLLLVSAPGEEANWNRRLLESAGPGTELWETGVGHTTSFSVLQEEFESRVIALFDEALLAP